MAKVTAVMTGDEGINKMLASLKGAQAKKIIRSASRKAMKLLLPPVREAAPRRSGFLRKNIKVRAIARSRSRVGTRITLGFEGQTFYGGFQEWGWKTGKRGSDNRKQIDGKNFMGRTAEAKAPQVLAAYREEIMRGIQELARGS